LSSIADRSVTFGPPTAVNLLTDSAESQSTPTPQRSESVPEGGRFDPFNWQILAPCAQHMDELVHHCLRELAFDGDLGEFVYVIREDGERAGSNLPMGVVSANRVSPLD